MKTADTIEPANARAAKSGQTGLSAIAGNLQHRGQWSEDEADRGEVWVATEQHALRRRYPRQRVAEDEAVLHLQPVPGSDVQGKRHNEGPQLQAMIGHRHFSTP